MALAAPRLRALHRGSRCVVNRLSTFLSEDIGSALKRGVKVCQRKFVNEVFGRLITQFALNLAREYATPIQRGKTQCAPISQSRPTVPVGRLFSAPGSNVCWQIWFQS